MAVVTFPRRSEPEIVRQCMCGNQFFWLHEDGRVECGRCHLFQTEVTGRWLVQDPAEVVRISDGDE